MRILRWTSILLVLAALFATVTAETVTGDLEARFGHIPKLEIDGVRYQLRPRLTSILLLGIDKTGEVPVEASNEYRDGGQADFQLLLVIDDNADTVTPIQINRDTMTELTVLGTLGTPTGSRQGQIALAHAFGDGREQSCELAVSALSKLLLDVPIDHYIAMSMDGIPAFNDSFGGVEVTLTEDFTAYDASMTEGTTLTLKGMQAQYFLRSRYYVGDQTNLARLARQRVYLDAAAPLLMQRVQESPNFINTIFDAIDPYTVTDLSRGRMLNYANSARLYEVLPIREIAGTAVLGESGYMEFYADEASLTQVVLDVFFAPM